MYLADENQRVNFDNYNDDYNAPMFDDRDEKTDDDFGNPDRKTHDNFIEQPLLFRYHRQADMHPDDDQKQPEAPLNTFRRNRL